MKKILVTGASGLLGSRVAALAESGFEVFPCYWKHGLKSDRAIYLDITDRKNVFKAVEKINPDAIIHAAALTNVDYCEEHPDEARKINVEGTRNLLEACDGRAKFIFISTDYVFDGTKGMYSEEDEANPINAYGRTKLEGEQLVRALCTDFFIARTTVLYGWNIQNRLNFVTWVIESLKAKKRIYLATDQHSTPTLAENCAEALLQAARKNKKGLYHVVGSECLNRYEFGLKIARIFELDAGLIEPVSSDFLKQSAPRPKNNCLSVKKAQSELGIKFLNAEEGLQFMKRQREQHE